MKNTWTAPKLIILARSKPEESILSFCKGQQGTEVAPYSVYWYCTLEDVMCPYCSVEMTS